jgi:thymidylate synthase (FAD)
MVWEAFNDYRLNAMFLTRLDLETIQALQRTAQAQALTPPFSQDVFLQVQPEEWRALQRCRERDECLSKLQRLGMVE